MIYQDGGEKPAHRPEADREEYIFGSLTRDHFRLFSTRNAEFYGSLLEHLETTLFSYRADTMKRQEVIAAIDEFTSNHEWRAEHDEDDIAPSGPASPKDQIYERLKRCKWLTEIKDGYKKVVDLDSEARLLLQALLDIKNGRVRSFGGEVLQVKTLLESAANDPENSAQNLAAAGKHSKRFMVNLRAITGALRKIEQSMRSRVTAEDVLEDFFGSYVADKLVADYKRLRTQNNPYRFRQDLITKAEEILDDDALLNSLARTYVREGEQQNHEDALRAIEGDLRVIIDVFTAVARHLSLIENTNARNERRISNTARFMNSIGSDRSVDFKHAIESLARMPQSMDEPLDLPVGLLDAPAQIDAASLFRARAKPRPAVPARARKMPPDPALVRFEQEKRAYAEMTLITQEKIKAYLDRQLAGHAERRGSEMTIETVPDLLVFRRLPELAISRLLPAYRIEILHGERIRTEWIICTEFRVRRAEILETHNAH